MNRLKFGQILFALLCVLILTACGSGNSASDLSAAKATDASDNAEASSEIASPALEESNDTAVLRGIQTEHETAILTATTPVPRKVANGLTGRGDKAEAPVHVLPDLPRSNDFPLRLPSELQTYSKDGNDSFMASPNASDSGASKVLDASSGDISWAIWQFPNIDSKTSVMKLVLETSAGNFSGNQPGYWVGIANYEKNKWQTLVRSTSEFYQRAFSVTEPNTSPEGNWYLFVVVNPDQGVTIDELSLEVDIADNPWQEVIVATNSAGWTNSFVWNFLDNPVIVWADYNLSNAWISVCDIANGADVLEDLDWGSAPIDIFPPFDSASDTNKIHWMDVKYHPTLNLPVVSMIYEGEINLQDPQPESSMLTFAPFDPNFGQDGAFRLYQGLWVDGAKQSTIDFRSGNDWGIALCAENPNYAPIRPVNDMEFRVITYDALNPPLSVDVNRSRLFGDQWGTEFLHPKLRYDPDNGNEVVCANGVDVYINDRSGDGWFYNEAAINSGSYGNIAVNPVGNAIGHIFTEINGNNKSLGFFDDLQNPGSALDEVAAVSGASEGIGGSQSLAFDPSGNPAIAYTQSDGSSIFIKYAFLDGANWVIEDVSPNASGMPGEEAGIAVDLDFDGSGNPGISWNHWTGNDSELRFAIRSI